MNKNNLVVKKFLNDNDRFADVMNVGAFHGQHILDGSNLKTEDGFSGTFYKGKKKSVAVEKYRDMIKKAGFGANFIMIGVENQSEIHCAMPVRIMGYDFLGYDKQLGEIRKEHQRKKDLTGAEYLAGFSKTDRLKPIFTLVIYYGEEPWTEPRSLHDILDWTELPEELKSAVADYPMHVLDVRRFKESEQLQTDARVVFGFLQRQNDNEKLKAYVEDNKEDFANMDQEAYDMISVLTNSENMLAEKTDYEKNGGVDVCKALQDLKAEGKAEGKAESIIELLQGCGEVSDALQEKISAQKDMVILRQWLRIAAKAESVAEFEGKANL